MELDRQSAMLERFCRNHNLGKWERDGRIVGIFIPHKRTLAALRELLLAVQERDAHTVAICPGHADPITARKWYTEAIREQTYSDLFPEEE